jgi:glycosyltransferase involved in cell wall biosynthesis
MIPTFNCASYLGRTLESVLSQDAGSDQMQIEVVDDCSTKDDPESVVRKIGSGRVHFYKSSKNQGISRNFNLCIARSRGHLVHILHGDDYVLPTFYTRVAELALANPTVAFYCTRSFVVDEFGAIEGISPRVKSMEIPTRAAEEMYYTNPIRTPSVVVRRSFYEQNGGFLEGLSHVADWEMWVRSISRGTGIALNEPLCSYRAFASNDTGRLARSADNLREFLRLGKAWRDTALTDFDLPRFTRMVTACCEAQMELFSARGDTEAYRANLKLWRELAPTSRKFRLFAREVSRYFKH